MNIAMYLLAKCNHYEHDKLIKTAHLILQKAGDYAASIVTEALIRSGSRHAQDIALSYLKDRAEYVASWKHESVLIRQERSSAIRDFVK